MRMLRPLIRRMALLMALLAALSVQGVAQAAGVRADCGSAAAWNAEPAMADHQGGCCCGVGDGDCTALCCAIPSLAIPLMMRAPVARMALTAASPAPLLSVEIGLDPPPPRRPARSLS